MAATLRHVALVDADRFLVEPNLARTGRYARDRPPLQDIRTANAVKP